MMKTTTTMMVWLSDLKIIQMSFGAILCPQNHARTDVATRPYRPPPVSLPAKANKHNLIHTILASQPALDAYNTLHNVLVQAEPPTPTKAKPIEVPPKEEPVAVPTAAVVEATPAAVEDPDFGEMKAMRCSIQHTSCRAQARSQKCIMEKTVRSQDPEKIKSRVGKFGINTKPTTSPPSKQKASATVTEEVDAEEFAWRKEQAERFGPKPTVGTLQPIVEKIQTDAAVHVAHRCNEYYSGGSDSRYVIMDWELSVKSDAEQRTNPGIILSTTIASGG
ncbi:hypothetical protein EDD18DRAFT_1101249 [Armillaria luteobubalina]|uniref:Uncharacterized protein n=1 Tax=Armillaria luteobubalina TaxID=153913 RepID=A0AA39UX57_9AGAR|nr:hypothetical protein EDD18DRAFT_1101249 [Armillaria luteobubalina]